MAVNKVEYSGDTLIDLTSDTVTPDSLIEGVTAHNASGEKVVGIINLSKYLEKTGDASSTTVEFTESDSMSELTTGESMKSLFGKLKLTVKNVISILRLIGNTDISDIGDGTVTGSLNTLNSNLPTVVKDNGWTLFKFNDGNFIGFFTYSTGSQISMTTAYGSIFISSLLNIQLPQNVLFVTRVCGNSAYLGGGIGGVSVSDTRSSITILTEVPFYFWSATSITTRADALFMCQGGWK